MASKENGRDKSLLVTFILWLFGGVFGLHHFYLRRDRHAFVWWSTLGGYGLGWIGDLFKLNTYVKDANEDHEFISAFIVKMQRNPRVCHFILLRQKGVREIIEKVCMQNNKYFCFL